MKPILEICRLCRAYTGHYDRFSFLSDTFWFCGVDDYMRKDSDIPSWCYMALEHLLANQDAL